MDRVNSLPILGFNVASGSYPSVVDEWKMKGALDNPAGGKIQ